VRIALTVRCVGNVTGGFPVGAASASVAGSMEAPMSNPFHRIHHICIVVADIEAAERAYAAIGIGPWFDYPKASDYVEFEVPNEAASKDTRYRCVDLGNIQLQLCQPSRLDSPQRRFLDEVGEGVYHLGFEVADRDAAEAQGRAFGLGVMSRGKRADGSGFCYFDTKPTLGVVLEVRNSVSLSQLHPNGTDPVRR
jgi:catechol 2,3-dioxygenase-like lactoylglutathione lyase family enzyme